MTTKWPDALTKIVKKSIVSIPDGASKRITKVSEYAFYECQLLESVNLPICKSVGDYAFTDCRSLTSIYLPSCISIGEWAFYECTSLTSAILPKCISIGVAGFADCSALVTISLPACVDIAASSFDCLYTQSLTEIHFAAANQATIEALNGYSSKFGADNATIYFDL